MSYVWPQEDIERVAGMLREGYSAGQIAPHFRKTRNSIIGVVMRNKTLREIGFARSPGAQHARVIKSRRRSPEAVKPERQPRKVAPIPHAEQRPTERVVYLPRLTEARATVGRPMVSLAHFECLYAVNDVESGGVHLFCGAGTRHGRFCEAHRAKVYQRASSPKQEAQPR